MNRRARLESFDFPAAGEAVAQEDELIVERAKSQAYEAGYSSGWEDAIASGKASRENIEAEFERNILNLTLTFNEAVAHVRRELSDFVDAIVEAFLPDLATLATREAIRAELLNIGDDLSDVAVEIVASPKSAPAIKELLRSEPAESIRFIENNSLTDNQVFLRIGSRELEVNFQPILTNLSNQLLAMRAADELKRQ